MCIILSRVHVLMFLLWRTCFQGQEHMYMTYVLHSLTENDLELDIWPIDGPLITKLTPKINFPGNNYVIKRCHTWFYVNQCMVSHPEANPESIAAILHLCKLQEFPKVAALATKLKNICRPILLLPYQKTIHFSQQLGSLWNRLEWQLD